MPAVPGSMRRKNVGPAIRPMSRAIAQPNPSSASTAAIWITVIQGAAGMDAEPIPVVAVHDDDGDERQDENSGAPARCADALLIVVYGKADALPLVAVGLEHLIETEIWSWWLEALWHLSRCCALRMPSTYHRWASTVS